MAMATLEKEHEKDARAEGEKLEPGRAELRAEDVHAATAVAGIMITIFLVALIMYSVIAILAAGGPS
jgi:hypothetical protein